MMGKIALAALGALALGVGSARATEPTKADIAAKAANTCAIPEDVEFMTGEINATLTERGIPLQVMDLLHPRTVAIRASTYYVQCHYLVEMSNGQKISATLILRKNSIGSVLFWFLPDSSGPIPAEDRP